MPYKNSENITWHPPESDVEVPHRDFIEEFVRKYLLEEGNISLEPTDMTKGTHNQPYVMFCGDETLSLDKGPYHLSLWTVDMRAKYRQPERMDDASFEDAEDIGMFRIGQLFKNGALVFKSIHYRPIPYTNPSKEIVLLHEPPEGYNDSEHKIIMAPLPIGKDVWSEMLEQD